ncbi:MAG: SDR family oxidoreductase [Parasphingorhabdus sp.]|uniref:SDR family oxidoreductase n=1 Tax=Parasphingorhabdus sp. TaxID=2709688 RepID=UPI003298CCB4
MPNLLITGANRGIGLELAREYAAAGWRVMGTARQPENAEQLHAIDNIEILQLDVAKDDSIARFQSDLGDQPVDLFINNAGIFGPQQLDGDAWLELMNINVIAPVKLANGLKNNVARSDHKKMVVISSQVGSIAENETGEMMYYRSSKAAVNQAWKSLANQWKDEQLTLTMMHPGWVQTDMGGPHADLTPQQSASGMRAIIDSLDHAQTGSFHDYSGREIPW